MSHTAHVVSHSHSWLRRCRTIHLFSSLHQSPFTIHPLISSTFLLHTNNQLCAALASNNHSLTPHLTFAQCAAPFQNTTIFCSRIMPPSSFVDNPFIHDPAVNRRRLFYNAFPILPSDPYVFLLQSLLAILLALLPLIIITLTRTTFNSLAIFATLLSSL